MSRSSASRRYLRRTLLATLFYLIAVFLDFHVFWHGRVAIPLAIGLALIPSIPIIAIIAIVGLYLKEEKDEFQRQIFIQALLWAAGITLAGTSFWSFLHLFAHIPAVDGFHVFVLFWVSFATATLPIRRYYGGTGE